MPLYEYRCGACGRTIEVLQSMKDARLEIHEGCGGALEKLHSSPAIQFKGAGWYVTDYSGKSSGGKAETPKSEGGKSEGGKSEGGSSESGKSESGGKSEGGSTGSGESGSKADSAPKAGPAPKGDSAKS